MGKAEEPTSKSLGRRFIEAIGGEAIRDVLAAADSLKETQTHLREAYGVTVDADEENWKKLSGDHKRDLPHMTQRRMQEAAHFLWESNLLANRLIELPVAFMLAEGVRLVAEDEVVQDVIDRFWQDPINNMDLKLVKKCRELALFGEQCYPAFVNEMNGHVRLGYLDPCLIDQVVTDPDNGEQKIGVITKRDDKGRYKKYRIIVNGPEQELFTERTQKIREGFTDGECFYFSINDLSNGTRGRSDLLAQVDWLDAIDQFLFGQLERSHALRSFIWDVTIKNATAEEIEARAKKITAPSPGSVRVHNDSEEWKAETPDLGAYDASAALKMFRNQVLGGATIPEHWFGGADDVNRATGDSMGEPTFKCFIMRQTYIGYMLVEIGKYVVRHYELKQGSRSEPDFFDPLYKLTAQFPEMVARDTTKYAAALQQVASALVIALDKNILTDETAVKIIENISGRLGVEFDAEEEITKARAEAAKKKEEDVFHTPPADEGAEGVQSKSTEENQP